MATARGRSWRACPMDSGGTRQHDRHHLRRDRPRRIFRENPLLTWSLARGPSRVGRSAPTRRNAEGRYPIGTVVAFACALFHADHVW